MNKISRLFLGILAVSAVLSGTGTYAQDTSPENSTTVLAKKQLRHIIGDWNVETDYIGGDGEVLGTVSGRYSFRWIVEDKIVSGVSNLPSLGQKAAILFFHNAQDQKVEMSSVGQDGRLWRMIGTEESEVRTTANETMPGGKTLMLRFTRHGVKPGKFESTMELSNDAGITWRVGNQQRFVRSKSIE
ncbi:MAG: hypothetical protein ABJN65_16820 [Parasphingorhabdus sp.]